MNMLQIFDEAKQRTLLSDDKLKFFLWACRQHAPVVGKLAEVGVYKGGTAKAMHLMHPARTLELYDTFNGMPEQTPGVDGHRVGDFADTSLKEVERFITDTKIDDLCTTKEPSFFPGKFPDTYEDDGMFYAFVHLDADQYETTQAGIDIFLPRLAKGGSILFDDYGWIHCSGVKKAIDEISPDEWSRHNLLIVGNQALMTRLK